MHTFKLFGKTYSFVPREVNLAVHLSPFNLKLYAYGCVSDVLLQIGPLSLHVWTGVWDDGEVGV